MDNSLTSENSEKFSLIKTELIQTLLLISRHLNEKEEFVENVLEKVEARFLEEGEKCNLENMVIEVFKDLGKKEAVPLYEIYCKERDLVYKSLQPSAKKQTKLLVGPTSNYEYFPWESSRIARALEREGGIPREVSEQVAHNVEQKVLQAGGGHITTALIRELVNSELFLKGYGYYMKKQSVLGIPKYNLNELLYPRGGQKTVKRISDLVDLLSSTALRQYALEEVFSPEVVKSHLSGALHIESLEWPIKFFTLAVSVPEKSGFGEFSKANEQVVTFLTLVQRLTQSISHSLNLYGLDNEENGWNSSLLKSLFIGVSQNFTTTMPYNVILQNPPGNFSDALYKIYSQASSLNKRGFLPDVYIPIASDSFHDKKRLALYRMCEMSLGMRNSSFVLKTDKFFTKNLQPQVKCVLETVIINLVQAAYRSGELGIEGFWQELKAIFDLVIKIHLDKKRFLFNIADGPLLEFSEEFYSIEDACCFLEICGLPEAIKVLANSEMTEDKGWELAVQTVSFLSDLICNVEERHGIHIKLVDYSHSEAGKRFAKLDASRFSASVYGKKQNFFYTLGPHFPASASLDMREKLIKEGQLHKYVFSCVRLVPEIDKKGLFELLRFAREETDAIMVKVC